MVTSGSKSSSKADINEVAKHAAKIIGNYKGPGQ